MLALGFMMIFFDVFLLLSVVKCLVASFAGQLFAHHGPDEGSLQDENVVSIPELEELAGTFAAYKK